MSKLATEIYFTLVNKRRIQARCEIFEQQPVEGLSQVKAEDIALIDEKLSGVREAAEDILQPGILWYLTNSDRKWLDMKISTANLRGLAALTESLKVD